MATRRARPDWRTERYFRQRMGLTPPELRRLRVLGLLNAEHSSAGWLYDLTSYFYFKLHQENEAMEAA